MKITSIALPDELSARIDRVAHEAERSRSYVVRKLLERSITGATHFTDLAFADAQPSRLKRTQSK
jgi:predicted DNA-binding protein